MKWLLLTVGFILAPALAQGTTYYVAKSGSDALSCSQAQSISTPKLTIGGGLRCLMGGDTLVIGAGIYPEFINAGQIPSGTSWARPTTVRAEITGSVVLLPSRGGTGGDAVWMSGQSYIVLDGLVIDAERVNVQGIRINDKGRADSNHIRLLNLEVKNAPANNCIGVKGNFIEIRGSRIHHCGSSKLHHGIYLRGSNHLVEGSEVYANYGFGIHQYDPTGTSDNVVVRYNHVYDNGNVGILIGSGYNNVAYGNVVQNNGRLSGAGGMSIGYFGANHSQIYDNRISGNAGGCLTILRGSTHSKVYDNTCWQNGRDAVTDSGSESNVISNRTMAPQLGRRAPEQ